MFGRVYYRCYQCHTKDVCGHHALSAATRDARPAATKTRGASPNYYNCQRCYGCELCECELFDVLRVSL